MLSKHFHPSRPTSTHAMLQGLLSEQDQKLEGELFESKEQKHRQPSRPADLFVPDEPFIMDVHLGQDSVLEEKTTSTPSDSFIQSLRESIPSYAEMKEYFDEQISTRGCLFTRSALCLISLILGSGAESWQFRDGMKDIRGDVLGIFPNSWGVTWFVTVIYFLQSVTINRKFTNDGIDQLIRMAKGEKPIDWEALPAADEIKAKILSFFTNAYALFSDIIANGYYLKQSGISNDGICFILGVIAGLSTIPTEGLQNYLTMRSLFSVSDKALKNALKIIAESAYYKSLGEKSREDFALVWGELSVLLRIALQKPENAHLRKEDGKELAAILLATLTKEKPAIKEDFQKLAIQPEIAEALAEKIYPLPRQNPATQTNGCLRKFLHLANLLEQTAKYALKFFGASQDAISSFVSVAAMFSVKSSPIKWILLLLGLANGINDLVFSGKNSEEALDAFKAGLAKGMPSVKQLTVFCLSLFFAGMIGHAQLELILDMLRNQTSLPSPLPEKFSETLAKILSWGAAARETINYTYYLEPILSHAFDEITNHVQQILHRFHDEPFDHTLTPAADEDDWMLVMKPSPEQPTVKLNIQPVIHDGYIALPDFPEEMKDTSPRVEHSRSISSTAGSFTEADVVAEMKEPAKAEKSAEGIFSYLSRLNPLQRFSLLPSRDEHTPATASDVSSLSFDASNHY